MAPDRRASGHCAPNHFAAGDCSSAASLLEVGGVSLWCWGQIELAANGGAQLKVTNENGGRLKSGRASLSRASRPLALGQAMKLDCARPHLSAGEQNARIKNKLISVFAGPFSLAS